MANLFTGVQTYVFNNLITKYGYDVTRTPVTKTTSNITGEETLTDGTATTITAYITRKTQPWHLDKEGLIEGGDALMLVKSTDTINKDDKITANGVIYRVHDILNRDQWGGNVAFKSCNLFKIG